MTWASLKEENDGYVSDKARTEKDEGLTQWGDIFGQGRGKKEREVCLLLPSTAFQQGLEMRSNHSFENWRSFMLNTSYTMLLDILFT